MNDNISDPGPQKAVTGGLVSAFTVLFAYAVARLTGAVEVPEIGDLTAAIYAVGTAIGAGLLTGAYAYAAMPVANYAALETADLGILDRICRLNGTAFAAVSGARAALEAGGGTLDAALAAAASALADLRLEVFGVDADRPDGDEITERTVILSTVVIVSAIEMHARRRDYMQPKLSDMAANGRPPTPDEWGAVTDRATGLHEAIRARC